jgi:hypothetical protein
MSRVLRARLVGAATLLKDTPSSTELALEMSKIQAAAVCEAVSRECDIMPAETKAEIAELIMLVPWCCAAHAKAALESLKSDITAKPKRRENQQWEQIFDFLPSSTWALLLDPLVAAPSKLDVLLLHCIRLGARLPSEGSLKVWASIWMLLSSGSPTEAFALAPSTKLAMYESVKATFRKMVRKASPIETSDFCIALPMPVHFAKMYPGLFQQVYSAEPPVPWAEACKVVDARLVLEFNSTYGCRGGTDNARKSAAPSSGRPSDPLELMGSMFEWMQRMMSGGAQEGANLAIDYRPSRPNLRRMPTLQLGDRPLIVGGAPPTHGELAAVPPAAVAAVPPPPAVADKAPLPVVAVVPPLAVADKDPLPVVAVVPPLAVAVPAPLTTLVAAPASCVGDAAKARAMLLYGMLEERDNERKVKKETERIAKRKVEGDQRKVVPARRRICAKMSPSHVEATPPKVGKPVALVAKSPSHAEPTPPKVDKPVDALVAIKRASASHERTRSQFMCRTGFRGPLQTCAIKYDAAKPGGEEEAKVKAAAWLKAELTRQGLA